MTQSAACAHTVWREHFVARARRPAAASATSPAALLAPTPFIGAPPTFLALPAARVASIGTNCYYVYLPDGRCFRRCAFKSYCLRVLRFLRDLSLTAR